MIEDLCVYVNQLAELPEPQCEVHFLRACLVVCRLQHLWRCDPPSGLRRSVAAFDGINLYAAKCQIMLGGGG